MKRKFFNAIALGCCFIFIMAVAADLDGKWTGLIKTPDGNELNVRYNFKVDSTRLTGTAESPEGIVPIDSGKVVGDSFSFQVTVDGTDYPHKGKIYGDSCGLDIDFGSESIHTTLFRDTAR